MNSFQKHKVMLLEYQELDIVGKKLSVKKPLELGSEKRSCYKRDTQHLNLVVDLNILFSFFGRFFFMISGVQKIHYFSQAGL